MTSRSLCGSPARCFSFLKRRSSQTQPFPETLWASRTAKGGKKSAGGNVSLKLDPEMEERGNKTCYLLLLVVFGGWFQGGK